MLLAVPPGTALSQTVVTLQEGLASYTGALDTKIKSDDPTANFGSTVDIEVDGSPDYGALLYWVLSGIPGGSTVASAEISVNVFNPSSFDYEIYESKRAWTELGATWVEYASGQSWQTAGASGPNDRGSTVLGSLSATSTGHKTINLNGAGVAVVQGWVDSPSSNLGFIIQDYADGTSDGIDFDTREVGTVANRPSLTITYYPAGSNIPPTASFEANPPGGNATLSVSFDASASTDVDGTIDTYDWTFGDGDSGAGVSTSHDYTSPGLYTAELIVTDDDGASDTTTTAIHVVTPGTIAFAVIGDFGDAGTPLADVAAQVNSWAPDFIITLGDNNYPDGEASTIDDNIGQYFSDFIYPYTGSYGSTATMNRFFPSLGNHDWHTISCGGGGCSGAYFDYFTLPETPAEERYYEFVWGDVHFFAIDSDTGEPDGTNSASTQAQWLQARLAASKATWKVVYFHHAAYSSSSNHGSTAYMQWPFAAWGADVVMGGHDHTYERIHRDGIVYYVNGLGGRSIYGLGTPVAGSLVQYNGDYGAMRVSADSTTLTIEFITRTGSVIDSYSLHKYKPVDLSALPLLHLDNFGYVGAFRLPDATYGISSLNYSEGPIAFNPSNESLLIVGHTYEQSIAEFEIPALVHSTTLGDLNMAGAPLQSFSTSLLDRAPSGNTQDINRIGGMAVVPSLIGPRLLVNGYEYYDAPGDNTHTTVSATNPDDIAGSTVGGFYTFEGGAGHTSGWISPIPPEWQDTLGGTFITGQSSGIPIISRTSVGPSAFVFDPSYIVDSASVPTPIPTTKLLDFTLANPLASDLSNSSGTNDLWTHLSRATYGVILPGTRTYATFGYSGGHGPLGVCYKCTQDDGNLCGGYCAPDADDYYQFAWLWDMNDLLAVMNGTMNAYDVRPYEYGPFPTPFEVDPHEIGGGAFDPASGLLYLTIQKGDREQGTYSNPPVVVAYKVKDFGGLALRVLLEGPYSPPGDSMTAEVNASLPTVQPFADPRFDGTALDYDAPDSVSSIPANVIDWVLLDLRSGEPTSLPMTSVWRQVGLLRSDGRILTPAGKDLIQFDTLSSGSYYVAVFQRNHIGVMSRDPLPLSDMPPLYDFSADSSRGFGVRSMRQLEPGVWGLFSGDENADGMITTFDFNEWLVQTKAAASGFQSADFDLDGLVNTSDFNIWLANTKAAASSAVPAAN